MPGDDKPKGKRRKAREAALQFLYQRDVRGGDAAPPDEADFWAEQTLDVASRQHAEALASGTRSRLDEIDRLLARLAEHWELDRMAVVDRNILRLGVYELLWQPDVPPKVAINEAIEISKKFGSRESSRFINGILDRVAKELRPAS